jgi:hypothetical protein
MRGSKCSWLRDAIGGFLGGCVDKDTSGVMHHDKPTFRESKVYLSDNKIQPMIHQLEATADRVMDRKNDDEMRLSITLKI